MAVMTRWRAPPSRPQSTTRDRRSAFRQAPPTRPVLRRHRRLGSEPTRWRQGCGPMRLHSAVVAQFSDLQGQTEEETWEWFKGRIPLGRFQTVAEGHRRDGCFPSLRSGGKHHGRRLQCRRRLGNALSGRSRNRGVATCILNSGANGPGVRWAVAAQPLLALEGERQPPHTLDRHRRGPAPQALATGAGGQCVTGP